MGKNKASDYCVVCNQEQQYSIWHSNRDIPIGWQSAGFVGNKEECLNYIEVIWTDLRPLSLRKAMEQAEQ